MRAIVVGLVLALLLVGGFVTYRFLRPPDAGAPDVVPVGAGDAAPLRPGPGRAVRAPSLRVELVEADMRTPAGGRSLQVYSHRPGKMELPKYHRTIRTGDDGIAAVSDLAAGSYLICAPGAAPGSPAPRTARVAVADEGPPATAVLVEAPPATDVLFDVRATFTPRYGVTSKVILRRVDDGSGELYEQPGVLRPGAGAFELELPAGRYEVGVFPLGELIVDPGARELVIGDERMEATIALSENPGRVDVVLDGLPADELPARVYPQPVAGLNDDRPGRAWWGPYRWHRADLQVPVLDGPRRVLVFGRDGTFRSVGIADLSSDRASIALEPAARVVIDWFGWDRGRDADAVVLVQAGDEEVARTLVPRFGDGFPWLERPALGGEVVVPRAAEVRVECRRADGSLAWERVLPLDADPLFVRID